MHENPNQHIAKAVEKLQWLSQDPEKRAQYEARQKLLRDQLSEIDYRERAARESLQVFNAKRMLKKGSSFDLIADFLDKPLSWVQKVHDQSDDESESS